MQGEEPLPLLPVQGLWPRRAARPWRAGAVHERTPQRPVEPSARGHAQDPHHLAADGWEVAIACADVPPQPVPPSGQETGVDRGVDSLATLATGPPGCPPSCPPALPARLRPPCVAASAAWRGASRGASAGAKRWRTAVARRANAQQPLARQRRDFHHQEARQVVEVDDVIHYEDLRVAHLVQTHLVQTHHRATSIREAGWRALLALLACKAASAGKRVPAVHPALTSQACSEGGALVQ